MSVPSVLESAYDAHTHIHLDLEDEGRSAANALCARLDGIALMSLSADDWEQALELSSAHERVHPLLGVHPWFAHRYAGRTDWLHTLSASLERGVLGIGEIGLDKQWRTPDTGRVEYQAQREVFAAQLELAAERQLPVSVHCVRAQGDLYEALCTLKQLPPTIYLHAFAGAAGTVEQLIRSRRFGARLYFGFAACINLRSPKTAEVIRAVPEDKLLLESDRSSARPSGRVEGELLQMLALYAELKGWGGVEEAAQRTRQNAQSFYAPAGLR